MATHASVGFSLPRGRPRTLAGPQVNVYVCGERPPSNTVEIVSFVAGEPARAGTAQTGSDNAATTSPHSARRTAYAFTIVSR
jgi:hypothetical protein